MGPTWKSRPNPRQTRGSVLRADRSGCGGCLHGSRKSYHRGGAVGRHDAAGDSGRRQACDRLGRLARLPPQCRSNRQRPNLPGVRGFAGRRLVYFIGRRGLCRAARRQRGRHRRHRRRQHLRHRSGERRDSVAQERGHPGPALHPALRQHRPAGDHGHACVRLRHGLSLRRGRSHRVPARPVRSRSCHRRGPLVARRGSRRRRSENPPAASGPGRCQRIRLYRLRRPGRRLRPIHW